MSEKMPEKRLLVSLTERETKLHIETKIEEVAAELNGIGYSLGESKQPYQKLSERVVELVDELTNIRMLLDQMARAKGEPADTAAASLPRIK